MLASKRHAGHAPCEFAEHLRIVERLWEDGVGTGLHIELGARHRAVDPLAGRRVCAGDEVEMAPGFGGRGHLGGHIAGVRQLLVVEVAALLRKKLVLDMDRSSAG
ncbi:hypothetical protein QOZ94_004342, partial [Xanthobacter agilis]|nr:hypothetical protein [Xanthobacter agilis]